LKIDLPVFRDLSKYAPLNPFLLAIGIDLSLSHHATRNNVIEAKKARFVVREPSSHGVFWGIRQQLEYCSTHGYSRKSF
jgi:hypothetical protein